MSVCARVYVCVCVCVCVCVYDRRKGTTERPFLSDWGTEEGLRLLLRQLYGEIPGKTGGV
jgi:hypothetical protein